MGEVCLRVFFLLQFFHNVTNHLLQVFFDVRLSLFSIYFLGEIRFLESVLHLTNNISHNGIFRLILFCKQFDFFAQLGVRNAEGTIVVSFFL